MYPVQPEVHSAGGRGWDPDQRAPRVERPETEVHKDEISDGNNRQRGRSIDGGHSQDSAVITKPTVASRE